jgi:hypothetical protein
VVIRYQDESGDLCILSSQPEWEALCGNAFLGPIIRIYIKHGMTFCVDASVLMLMLVTMC